MADYEEMNGFGGEPPETEAQDVTPETEVHEAYAQPQQPVYNGYMNDAAAHRGAYANAWLSPSVCYYCKMRAKMF